VEVGKWRGKSVATDAVKKGTHHRQLEELAQRRREAMALLEEGMTQSDVAREMGVGRQTVSRWARLMDEYPDDQAWRPRPLGRPARLNSAQKKELLRELAAHYHARSRANPETSWSLQRVAQLIEERFVVSYSLGQVSTMLNELVGCLWSDNRSFWAKVKKLADREEV
jgi:transposase